MGLSEVIIKHLDTKIITKKVISDIDFIETITGMGLLEDYETQYKIIDELDDKDISIEFSDLKNYTKIEKIRENHRMFKRLKISKNRFNESVNYQNKVNLDKTPEWLMDYRDDKVQSGSTSTDKYLDITKLIKGYIKQEMNNK